MRSDVHRDCKLELQQEPGPELEAAIGPGPAETADKQEAEEESPYSGLYAAAAKRTPRNLKVELESESAIDDSPAVDYIGVRTAPSPTWSLSSTDTELTSSSFSDLDPRDPADLRRQLQVVQFKSAANKAFRRDDFEEAVRLYSLAIAIGQGLDDSLYQNRSIAFMRTGNVPAALADAVHCVGLNPRNPKGHYRQARAMLELNHPKKALRSLEFAHKLAPDDEQIKKLIIEITRQEMASVDKVGRILERGNSEQEAEPETELRALQQSCDLKESQNILGPQAKEANVALTAGPSEIEMLSKLRSRLADGLLAEAGLELPKHTLAHTLACTSEDSEALLSGTAVASQQQPAVGPSFLGSLVSPLPTASKQSFPSGIADAAVLDAEAPHMEVQGPGAEAVSAVAMQATSEVPNEAEAAATAFAAQQMRDDAIAIKARADRHEEMALMLRARQDGVEIRPLEPAPEPAPRPAPGRLAPGRMADAADGTPRTSRVVTWGHARSRHADGTFRPRDVSGAARSWSPMSDEADNGALLLAGRAVPFATAAFGATKCGLHAANAVAVDPPRADGELTNGSALSGHVAVVERGVISFVQKARRVQKAGAIAVLFVNNDEQLFTVGGEDGHEDVTIPVAMIRRLDGVVFKQKVTEGSASVSLSYLVVPSSDEESDEGDAEVKVKPRDYTSVAFFGEQADSPTPSATLAEVHEEMLKAIKLTAGWHSLRPVPQGEIERRERERAASAESLSPELRRGKLSLRSVTNENGLSPLTARRKGIPSTPRPTAAPKIAPPEFVAQPNDDTTRKDRHEEMARKLRGAVKARKYAMKLESLELEPESPSESARILSSAAKVEGASTARVLTVGVAQVDAKNVYEANVLASPVVVAAIQAARAAARAAKAELHSFRQEHQELKKRHAHVNVLLAEHRLKISRLVEVNSTIDESQGFGVGNMSLTPLPTTSEQSFLNGIADTAVLDVEAPQTEVWRPAAEVLTAVAGQAHEVDEAAAGTLEDIGEVAAMQAGMGLSSMGGTPVSVSVSESEDGDNVVDIAAQGLGAEPAVISIQVAQQPQKNAAEAAAVQLPAGWEAAISRSTGDLYYEDNHTGVSTFDKPRAPAQATEALPAGWVPGETLTSEPCVVNTATGERFFELPHWLPATEPLLLPSGWKCVLSDSIGVTYFAHEDGRLQNELPPRPTPRSGNSSGSDGPAKDSNSTLGLGDGSANSGSGHDSSHTNGRVAGSGSGIENGNGDGDGKTAIPTVAGGMLHTRRPALHAIHMAFDCRTVIASMASCPNAVVQESGCRRLITLAAGDGANLDGDRPLRRVAIDAGAIAAADTAMKAHPDRPTVIAAGCRLLATLARDTEHQWLLGLESNGSIGRIEQALVRHSNNSELVAEACVALLNLDPGCIEPTYIPPIIEALKKHVLNPAVVLQGTKTIRHVIENPKNVHSVNWNGGVSLLESMMGRMALMLHDMPIHVQRRRCTSAARMEGRLAINTLHGGAKGAPPEREGAEAEARETDHPRRRRLQAAAGCCRSKSGKAARLGRIVSVDPNWTEVMLVLREDDSHRLGLQLECFEADGRTPTPLTVVNVDGSGFAAQVARQIGPGWQLKEVGRIGAGQEPAGEGPHVYSVVQQALANRPATLLFVPPSRALTLADVERCKSTRAQNAARQLRKAKEEAAHRARMHRLNSATREVERGQASREAPKRPGAAVDPPPDEGQGTRDPALEASSGAEAPMPFSGPMSNVAPSSFDDEVRFAQFAQQSEAGHTVRIVQGYDAEGGLGGDFSEKRPPPGLVFGGYTTGGTGVVWKLRPIEPGRGVAVPVDNSPILRLDNAIEPPTDEGQGTLADVRTTAEEARPPEVVLDCRVEKAPRSPKEIEGTGPASAHAPLTTQEWPGESTIATISVSPSPTVVIERPWLAIVSKGEHPVAVGRRQNAVSQSHIDYIKTAEDSSPARYGALCSVYGQKPRANIYYSHRWITPRAGVPRKVATQTTSDPVAVPTLAPRRSVMSTPVRNVIRANTVVARSHQLIGDLRHELGKSHADAIQLEAKAAVALDAYHKVARELVKTQDALRTVSMEQSIRQEADMPLSPAAQEDQEELPLDRSSTFRDFGGVHVTFGAASAEVLANASTSPNVSVVAPTTSWLASSPASVEQVRSSTPPRPFAKLPALMVTLEEGKSIIRAQSRRATMARPEEGLPTTSKHEPPPPMPPPSPETTATPARRASPPMLLLAPPITKAHPGCRKLEATRK
jgi:tetratricopeptide (TPR) repeat protein